MSDNNHQNKQEDANNGIPYSYQTPYITMMNEGDGELPTYVPIYLGMTAKQHIVVG